MTRRLARGSWAPVAGALLVAVVVLELVLLLVAAPASADPGEPQPSPGPTPAAPEVEPEVREPSPSPGPSPDPLGPAPPPPDEEPSAPVPSPGPTPPAHEVIDEIDEGDGSAGWFGGLFDIPGAIADAIVEAITGFLDELIEAAMEPFLALLGQTLLSSPQVTSNNTLVAMWSGSLALAGAGYVLLVMAGGLTLMGYETVQTRYALKQIAPRLAVGLTTAALSLTVMDQAIGLANALSAAIMSRELDGTGRGVAELLLGGALSDALLAGAPMGGMIHVALLAVVLLVLLVAVVIGYMVRAALIALLAVAGPLALACHALPQTEPVARLWWRALAGCLVIQVAQATALAVAVRLYFAPGNTILGHPNPSQLESLLSGICLFWVLWKIPGWMVQVILRGTPASAPHSPAPVRMLRNIAIAMLLRRYLPAAGAAARQGARVLPPTVGPRRGSGGPPRPALPSAARPPSGGGPGGGRPPGPGGGGPGPAPTGAGGRSGARGGPPGSPSAGVAGPGAAGSGGGGAAEPPVVTYEWGTPRSHHHAEPSAASSGTGRRTSSAPGPRAGSGAPGSRSAPGAGDQPAADVRGASSPRTAPSARPAAATPRPAAPWTPSTGRAAPGPAAAGAQRPVPARPALRPVPMRLALEPARPTRPGGSRLGGGAR